MLFLYVMPELEEENKKVLVIDEIDDEGEMLSVSGKNDASDDSSQHGSDDGHTRITSNKPKVAVMDHGFPAISLFPQPSLLDKGNDVTPAPAIATVIHVAPAPKRSCQTSVKVRPPKSSLGCDGTETKEKSTPIMVAFNGTSKETKASMLFGSPAPTRPMHTVTPKSIETVSPEKCLLLSMRYMPLFDEETEQVHDVLHGQTLIFSACTVRSL
jgi:hypothetical protein